MASPALAFNVALASLLSLIAGPVQAEWQPMQEPAVWQSRRGELLPGDGWIFMEALDTPALKAAEYIRAPQRVDGAVEVEAGLLIQRAGQDQWTQRVLPMRANCAKGQLEQRQPMVPGLFTPVAMEPWLRSAGSAHCDESACFSLRRTGTLWRVAHDSTPLEPVCPD